MAGSIDVMLRELNLESVESLPDDFDPTTVINDPLPPPVADDDCSGINVNNGGKLVNGNEKVREIVLGRNVHTSCLEVTEPDDDDEVTGEREAQMASVLARYRKSLLERTKHHLGMNLLFLALLNAMFMFMFIILFLIRMFGCVL